MRSSIVVLVVSVGVVGCGAPVGSSGTTATVATTVCASGKKWTGGDTESPLMNPGQACITCHTTQREGPSFAVAGTVYADASQADDCLGTATGMSIELTDATGKVTTLTPNSSGNFYLESRTFQTPYTAKLISSGGTRAMAAKQTVGDCNSCHTATGLNGAPGRISP